MIDKMQEAESAIDPRTSGGESREAKRTDGQTERPRRAGRERRSRPRAEAGLGEEDMPGVLEGQQGGQGDLSRVRGSVVGGGAGPSTL